MALWETLLEHPNLLLPFKHFNLDGSSNGVTQMDHLSTLKQIEGPIKKNSKTIFFFLGLQIQILLSVNAKEGML